MKNVNNDEDDQICSNNVSLNNNARLLFSNAKEAIAHVINLIATRISFGEIFTLSNTRDQINKLLTPKSNLLQSNIIN